LKGKKKSLTTFPLCLLLSVSCRDIFVRWNATGGDGSQNLPYGTIAAAEGVAANNSDNIVVLATGVDLVTGTTPLISTSSKNLTLRAEPRGGVKILCTAINTVLFTVTNAAWNVDGFIFSGSGKTVRTER
jgi:hypothetical protein